MWTKVSDFKPEEGVIVNTKIIDGAGERMLAKLVYKYNLWWHTDMKTYVYYQPTHWCSLNDWV